MMGNKSVIVTLVSGVLCVMALQAQAKPPQAGDDASSLPPGLQKKVARGGELPPGWERKLKVGEPMDADLYRQAEPAPRTVTARLPAGAAGTIEVVLEGKAVRLHEATREIVEIFELDR